MSILNTVALILATISLFLYSLERFGKEINKIGDETLKNGLNRFTSNRFSGFFAGLAATALIQSSSAVTGIVVSFVNSGTLSFANSLSVILGANVGTTTTAWLVSFKIFQFAPFIMVGGMLLSFFPRNIHLIGKTVFLFGFILFSLELVSNALEPVKNDPILLKYLAYADNRFWGVAAGIAITALIQSSSVTIGLCLLLVDQDAIPPEGAVAVVIGSNLGSTTTALLAALKFSRASKRAALANFLFNLTGVLLFIPFIGALANLSSQVFDQPIELVALAHLIFNVTIGILFLVLLKPFARFMDRIMPPSAEPGNSTPVP